MRIIIIGAIASLAVALCAAATSQELVWRERAELPLPVAGYMAGVSHGKLFIIGGSYWEHVEKKWTDRVQVFDPRANRWQPGPPLPEPRSDAASVALGQDIYLFGGGMGGQIRRDALVLHGGAWRTVPEAELPEPRLYATAVAHAGYIYLLGGISKAGDYHTAGSTFWRWRPGQTGWETLPPLPGPGRINHAMAAIADSIYVFGGAAAGEAPGAVVNLNDAYRFDPSHRQWTRLADLPVANRSWWAVSLGHSALLLAGYTDDYARAVYRYIPGQNAQPAGGLPQGLADVKFFRIGGAVVGAGGEAGPGVRGKWTLQAEVPFSWLHVDGRPSHSR